MLKKLLCFIVLVPIMAMGSAYAITCQSNEFKYIDNNSNEECIENKFQITTTNDTDHFVFSMSAKGTFYIDWGDGVVEKIERTTTTMTEYSHNYNTTQSYVIKFGGQATGYSSSNNPAILFGILALQSSSAGTADGATNNTNLNIAIMHGSLGAIFPIIRDGASAYYTPSFFSTFRKCSNLTNISEDLFGRVVNGQYVGVNGSPVAHMFRSTFAYCSGLTSTNIDDPDQQGYKFAIPDTLFGRYINGTWYGLKSSASNLFRQLFMECTNLSGTIPKNLLAGVSGTFKGYDFYMTFYHCYKLTGSIPEDLFGREINGNYVGYNAGGAQESFFGMFYGCSKLNGAIPEKLFGRTINGTTYGVKGPLASYGRTFANTFYNCSGLTGTDIDDPNNPGMKYAIHPNLFSTLSTVPTDWLFRGTFGYCSSLTGTIPGNLFRSISGAPKTYLFYQTFRGCSGLTGAIPEDLFASISGVPATYMFQETFYGCSGLTGPIPADLFKNISGAPANNMFLSTFYGCSGLTGTNISDPNNTGMYYAIPPTLFSGIAGAPAGQMYDHTFYGCSGLNGTIPDSLFGNLNGAPASKMFYVTFQGCTALTGPIPANLFAGISGKPASYMFESTFQGCSNLSGTNIEDTNNPGTYFALPPTLFAGISGAPASYMFQNTFNGCSKITGSIPPTLFSGIYGKPATHMFFYTFSSCTNLGKDTIGGPSKYYIPPELFAGIDNTTTETYQMTGVFNNTGLLTTCPAGTSQYMTGFESWFQSKKSCTECSVNYPNYDSDTQQCYAQLSFVSDDGQTLLRSDDIYYDANYPNGYTLPAYTPTRADSTFDGFVNGAGTAIGTNDVLSGNQVVYPKWSFHCDSDKWWNFKISENESTRMCLCTDKRTEHTIQFNHNGTIYHAMLTPASEHDYTINKNTPRKLKVNMGGTIYNAYDASVLFDD